MEALGEADGSCSWDCATIYVDPPIKDRGKPAARVDLDDEIVEVTLIVPSSVLAKRTKVSSRKKLRAI